MNWTVESMLTEDQWTEDYVRTILASRPTHTPPQTTILGSVVATWFPTEPGVAFIHTEGGTVDDRIVAEAYLREWLRNAGWQQAKYSLYRNDLKKQAAWPDIEAKAKRLIQSGNVQLLRNGPQNIVGHVVGDHGEYQTEISREDPNSQVITQWQCECPWDQYAWQRTRQWKPLEGRPCAHVLATYWASQSAPLDEEVSPGQPQQTLFDPGTAQPAPGGLTNTPAQPLPQPAQLSIPGISVPAPEAPKPPEILPPAPLGAPAPPGVVSVPGARPPSPADPTQYPGGTFSKTADMVDGDEDDWVEIMGQNAYDEWQFSDRAQIETTPYGWSLPTKDAAAGDTFQNSDMVRIEETEWGIMEGKSEDHGAGQFKEIPARSIGEVLGQDPNTGWVDVAFAGPQANAGPMEPYHVRAWVDPGKLTPMPGIQKPGPFVRRR